MCHIIIQEDDIVYIRSPKKLRGQKAKILKMSAITQENITNCNKNNNSKKNNKKKQNAHHCDEKKNDNKNNSSSGRNNNSTNNDADLEVSLPQKNERRYIK